MQMATGTGRRLARLGGFSKCLALEPTATSERIVLGLGCLLGRQGDPSG